MADIYTIKVFTNVTKQTKKTTFKIEVDSKSKVRDHIRQISETGYFRKAGTDKVEWYAPRSIIRIVATGPGLALGYDDTDISE